MRTRVIHNSAGSGGYGGGIATGVPLPGPMPLIGGKLILWHTLVAANTAGHAGGIFVRMHAASKVVGNVVDNCEPTNTITGCTG